MGLFLLRGSFLVLAGFTPGRGRALPRVLLVRCTSSCVLPYPTGDDCPRTPTHHARRIKAASFLRSSRTPAFEPPRAPHEFMPSGPCQSCGFAGTGRGIPPFDEPVCQGYAQPLGVSPVFTALQTGRFPSHSGLPPAVGDGLRSRRPSTAAAPWLRDRLEMGPDPPGPPPRPPKTTVIGRPCEGFQGDPRLKALSSPEDYPHGLIRSATAKMTDRQLWTCVRTASYPAFMNRWSLSPRRLAAALAIAYPYCPLHYGGITAPDVTPRNIPISGLRITAAANRRSNCLQ